MPDNIIYIHTTSTIIDYITVLSKRYVPDKRIFHMLDETMLFDIKQGNSELARHKLKNLLEGGMHSGAERFMITCTSTGQLIDSLDDELISKIVRLEDSAIAEVKRHQGKIAIVYTNPTVWPEMQIILERAGVAQSMYEGYYIAGAFDSLLSGNIALHDKLIADSLNENRDSFDAFMLAQVSICNAKERLGTLGVDEKVISMAELCVQHLKEKSHA